MKKNNLIDLDKGRVVYMNGKYVPENEAKISIFDSALMFGDMVFEMTRSFNKKQFKLKEHLERLLYGVKIYRIPLNLNINDLEKICLETVERNDKFFESTDEHRLMINISRGPLGIYAPVFDNIIEPTVVVADFPLKWTVASMGKLYDEGVNAVLVNQRAIPSHLMDPKIKNRSRVFYQMANIEASMFRGKNNWALMMDTDGFIAEGSGDNFFIIKNGTVITPEGRNCLVGISRNYIFEICKELGIACIEKNIEPYDIYTADEAFMTGTPFCVLPVFRFNETEVGDGKFGKITKEIIKKWGENVGVDIIKQIKKFEKECKKLNKNSSTTPYQFSSKT
jgi:branched-chain amino acid aminotransferase|tara:strand:+ start:18412 stop:19422 length:1011 start_codon:yes stop_codon:yes gene_type:complete